MLFPSSRFPSNLATRLTVAAALLLSLPAGAAFAQPAAPTPVTQESLLSDMWVRLALEALADSGSESDVRADQLTRAEILLDMALELTPEDADLLALRINLARRVGDAAALSNLMRRYLELRPSDDAVQYELVMLELSEVETLDGRLALLEDQLRAAEHEPGFSEALRSRLASAAAVAAHEIGHTPQFLRHLTTAVRSDASNGQAAALTYQLAVDRQATPLQRGTAAANLVRARPQDSDARLIMADALASLGVFDRAVRQFEVAAKLPRTQPIPATALAAWVRSLIASGELDQAEQLIVQVEQAFAGQQAQGQPAEPLPMEFELLRRVMAGEGEAGTAAYERAVATLQGRLDAGDADAALELAWVKALFGPDTEQATQLLQGRDQADVRYQRAIGFVHLREGADRWARQAFESIADADPISAYGLAQLRGRDEAGQARYLREVVQQFPGSFGGLLAARQLHEMRRVLETGPEGRALTQLMDRMPSGLWRFDADRNPWVNLRVEFAHMRTGFLEPIVVRLRLRNMLNMPLALDNQTGLGTTAFVSIAAYAAGRPIGDVPPVVLDLGRRLALAANETLVIETRLDRSLFGLLLAGGAVPSLTYNATVLLDPQYAPNGAVVTGLLGAIENVRSVQAFVPSPSPETLERWVAELESGEALTRFTAMARLAQGGAKLVPPTVEASLARRCINGLIAGYEAGGPIDKAWIMLHLDGGENASRSEFRAILEQAQRSDDPAVRIAYLLGQVRLADDTALASAIRDGVPRVRRFAEAHREHLAQPAPAEASGVAPGGTPGGAPGGTPGGAPGGTSGGGGGTPLPPGAGRG